jgi:hypothetical protein
VRPLVLTGLRESLLSMVRIGLAKFLGFLNNHKSHIELYISYIKIRIHCGVVDSVFFTSIGRFFGQSAYVVKMIRAKLKKWMVQMMTMDSFFNIIT